MKAKVKTERHSVRSFAELCKWVNKRPSKCLLAIQYQSVRQARNISRQTTFGECEYLTFLILLKVFFLFCSSLDMLTWNYVFPR